MDPVSQIVAGETIAKHGMMVVGWYHSHPSFQPDPSVTDVHNQGNYQHLFGDHGHPIQSKGNLKYPPPFVGLIIGTYDSKNPSAESVMRWFHVTPKETGNQTSSASNRTLARGSSFASSVASAPPLETETGWFRERVFFPMEIRVMHRKIRRFKDVEVEKDGGVIDKTRQEMTASGTSLRREIDSRLLLCGLSRHHKKSGQSSFFNTTSLPNKTTGVPPVLCQPITATMNGPSKRSNSSDHQATHERPANSLATVAKSSSPPVFEANDLPDKPPEATIATIDCRAEQGVPSKVVDSKALPSDALAALKYGALMRNEKCTETTQNTALIVKSPVLLEGLLAQSDVAASPSKPAYPLLFTRDELDILRLGENDGVTDLIHAGVIWHAVEREQLSYADEGSVDMESPLPLPVPQTSSSILELLLLPPNGSKARAQPEEDEKRPKDLLEDDAAIAHIIDVILSHYSTDSQRIDPFGYWAGSGDKGMFGKDMKSIREKFEVNGTI